MRRMDLLAARRVVRASAAYDLVVTVAFALPWTASVVLRSLGAVHDRLGLTGAVPSPDDVYQVLFAGLMGSLVTVWAAFRLARPTLAAGAADTVARVLFSLGMTVALLGGASPLVLALLVPEVASAVVQGTVVLRARAASAPAPVPVGLAHRS